MNSVQKLLINVKQNALRLSVAFSILLSLAPASVKGQPLYEPGYWAKRESTLAQYTYEWELNQHELFILIGRPVPKRKLEIGTQVVELPGVEHGWEFNKSTYVTLARQGDFTAVTGSLPNYNLSANKA